jgi:hypothetical protein
MKLSLSLLSLVATIVVMTATGLFRTSTASVGTAVIATKSDSQMGGGFAQILPESLTEKQSKILTSAYKIAKEDGHKNPELLQGIILQETKAGAMKSYAVAGQEFGLKLGERYYGLGQIKLSAAKHVLSKYPEMRKEYNFQTSMDEEIIAKLIENNDFNMAIASKYLKILKDDHGFRDDAAIAGAYNQGPSGAKKHVDEAKRYADSVMKFVQSIKIN